MYNTIMKLSVYSFVYSIISQLPNLFTGTRRICNFILIFALTTFFRRRTCISTVGLMKMSR